MCEEFLIKFCMMDDHSFFLLVHHEYVRMSVYDDFEMVQPMPEDQVCRSSFPVMSDNF